MFLKILKTVDTISDSNGLLYFKKERQKARMENMTINMSGYLK